MCLPLAVGLAAASAVATIGGTLVGAQGAANQANYAAQVSDQNARLSQEQSHNSVLNTNLEAQRNYRKIGQTKGAQQASMAANGVDTGFGSALNVQHDTAMLGAEDTAQIYKAGNERTKGYDINAFNYATDANANRAKAKGAIIGGVFSSLGTALGAASQISRMSPKFGVSG
jgi:hypothetical protein